MNQTAESKNEEYVWPFRVWVMSCHEIFKYMDTWRHFVQSDIAYHYIGLFHL